MNNYEIDENRDWKTIKSNNFKLFFNKHNGYTITSGNTLKDDPEFCEFGPIIADIEVSTVCSKGCQFCYKANTSKGQNMSFETFEQIFNKFPKTLTQIAFGIGDINANPDLKKIIQYCRNNQYQEVIPNITINGENMNSEWYDFLAKECGAVAVSYYDDDACFNAVNELTSRTKLNMMYNENANKLRQVNIHCLLSEETFDKCLNLIYKVKTDQRLKHLNAVVFLLLKKKGRGQVLNNISDRNYDIFIKRLKKSGINFGFDSCGSQRFLPYAEKIHNVFIEPCESGLFSSYINTEGKFFPCSFCEGTENWQNGIDVTQINDFIQDVWNSNALKEWRKTLLNNNRQCPKYKI